MRLALPVKALLTTTLATAIATSVLAMPSTANRNNASPRQGLPGRRISGGVREGNCFRDFDQSLVAIMPRNNLGKTISARPSFWFSVPATLGEKTSEFLLIDELGEIVYGTQVKVSGEQGISEFQLPASATELAVDKTYTWTFSIGCTDSSQFVVKGNVQRVAVPNSVKQRLEVASPEEKVALYGSTDLWHEQVTTLVNLRRSDPANADFQMEWAELLATTGLISHVSGNIASAMSTAENTFLSAD